LLCSHPPYENRNLFLANTFDGVCFEGTTEKIKTSLRVAFSIFDSLAGLLNKYFNCGCEQYSFKTRWIKENLSHVDNIFIDALYFLACDLTDDSGIKKKLWKAPNPDGAEIRKVRNSIEHGWLRVVRYDSEPSDSDIDYAHLIHIDNLKYINLSVLSKVRAALMYLCFAIKLEEDKKEKDIGVVGHITVPQYNN